MIAVELVRTDGPSGLAVLSAVRCRNHVGRQELRSDLMRQQTLRRDGGGATEGSSRNGTSASPALHGGTGRPPPYAAG
jgi:hypothetical protein